jgi:hypothetical protein
MRLKLRVSTATLGGKILAFETIWEDKGVLFTFSGVVTAKEIVNMQELFYGNERSDSSKYILFDVSRVEQMFVEEEEIKIFAARDSGASKSIPFVKVALISKDQNIKLLLQKYIDVSLRLNKTWSFEIFDNITTAREWINLSNNN